MTRVLWIIAIAIALFALDRLFLRMEARGWIYWRKTKKRTGGDMFLGVESFVNPAVRHVEEAKQDRLEEEADDGDDESGRAPTDRITSHDPS